MSRRRRRWRWHEAWGWRRCRPRQALPEGHRAVSAAHQGRRGPIGTGHRGRPRGGGRARRSEHQAHPGQEARAHAGSSPPPPPPSRPSCRRTSASWCPSPRSTRRRVSRCSTWSRRGTSDSSTPWRSSTGARASSSRPMPRGGSARPSPAASPTPAAPSACRSTPATC